MRQKPYAKLKLQINDAKSAVASAYERDYLSYEVCVGKGRELKYAVGNKALDNFMTRIRRLTRRREGRSMEQVARLLKHKFPALGDQLLGIVELAHSDKDLGSSTRLAQAAIDQVDSVVRQRDFSDAVPRPKHRFWAKTLAVPAVLAILALAIVPAAGFNAMSRWLMPWI